MANVKFYKVTALPETLTPNAFYYVENGDYAESYLTDDAGTAKKLGNSSMIEALTQNINAGFFS
ncbi:MAG: hypothetical protein ACO387_03470 [Flavobacteriaceae bacterium]